jgi:hypothetical protein
MASEAADCSDGLGNHWGTVGSLYINGCGV